MEKLEALREKLHIMLESGDQNDILNLSRELDALILFNMRSQQKLCNLKQKTVQEKHRKNTYISSHAVPNFVDSKSKQSILNALK